MSNKNNKNFSEIKFKKYFKWILIHNRQTDGQSKL